MPIRGAYLTLRAVCPPIPSRCNLFNPENIKEEQMISLIVLAKRKQDMSKEQFREYYETNHVNLAHGQTENRC